MTSPDRLNYDLDWMAYARHRHIHPCILERLCETLTPTTRVLEMGCGTGNYIVAIESIVGCSCSGVDPSAGMLSAARARSQTIDFCIGTAERTDCPAGSFDLVFAVDVIHHVGDRPACFREKARLLRPGGRVCIVTDSEWIIRNRHPLSSYFPETVSIELERYPRIAELRAMMTASGFSSIQECMVEYAQPLTDTAAYREKAFSTLHLIDEDAFQRGIARMERDLASGPVQSISRYVMLWGIKEQSPSSPTGSTMANPRSAGPAS